MLGFAPLLLPQGSTLPPCENTEEYEGEDGDH